MCSECQALQARVAKLEATVETYASTCRQADEVIARGSARVKELEHVLAEEQAHARRLLDAAPHLAEVAQLHAIADAAEAYLPTTVPAFDTPLRAALRAALAARGKETT